jgi:ketosteroid isomerase-like protein
MATANLAFDTGTAAFNAGDFDAFAQSLADDVVFQAPGGVWGESKDACVRFHRNLYDAFPDAHLNVHDVHVADHVAVEEGTLMGTHEGVARTGRSVTLDYVRVTRQRDGKTISMSLMLDRLGMLEQLGLIADDSGAR